MHRKPRADRQGEAPRAGADRTMSDQSSTSECANVPKQEIRSLLDRALAIADENKLGLVAARISEALDALSNEPGTE